MMRRAGSLSEKRGFHLLEIVLAVSIIAILLCVAVPSYRHLEEKARRVRVSQEAMTVLDMLKLWMEDARTEGVFDEIELFACAGNLRDNTNPLYSYIGDGFGDNIWIERITLNKDKEIVKLVYISDEYQVIYEKGKELSVTHIEDKGEKKTNKTDKPKYKK